MEAKLNNPSRSTAGAVSYHCGETSKGTVSESGRILLYKFAGGCTFYSMPRECANLRHARGPGIGALRRFTD